MAKNELSKKFTWIEIGIGLAFLIFVGWIAFSIVTFVSSVIFLIVKISVAVLIIAVIAHLVMRRSKR